MPSMPQSLQARTDARPAARWDGVVARVPGPVAGAVFVRPAVPHWIRPRGGMAWLLGDLARGLAPDSSARSSRTGFVRRLPGEASLNGLDESVRTGFVRRLLGAASANRSDESVCVDAACQSGTRASTYHGGVDKHRLYFVLMGTCLTLIVLAWFVVRLFSVPLAMGMSVVAAVLPPLAAMVGNRS